MRKDAARRLDARRTIEEPYTEIQIAEWNIGNEEAAHVSSKELLEEE